MRKINIATVFSGIGAFEQALKKMNIEYNTVFACDNGERELKITENEINDYIKNNNLNNKETNDYVTNLYNETNKVNYVEQSYKANYPIDNDAFFQDIRFLNGKEYKNTIDIFVGGSPCQSFSISGKRLGLEDARGTLFYEYARLVNEIQPKVFIYENVPGMLNHDKGNTWKVISHIFDDLNYKWKLFKLSATDYGIPQNRTRLYVVGFREDLNVDPLFEILDIPKIPLELTLKDFLEDNVSSLYYHGEKGFKWITKPLSLKKRVSINGSIARTQAANQQFNWCGDMIFEPYDSNKIYDEKIYIGEYKGIKGVARKLTPRECLRLMGFEDDFKIVVPDTQMYRQAGNSIVVNVLEAIIREIIKTNVFEEMSKNSLNIGTLFSGIGSFEWALKRLNIEHNIEFACDNGDVEIDIDVPKELNEIKKLDSITDMWKYEKNLYESMKIKKTNFVQQSYFANFDIEEDRFFQNVMLLDGLKFKDNIDILVGGSPCQSFSMMGYQRGLEDARGTLFYEYARLVNEIQPKVFIYENVQGLLKHDKGNTWKVISSIFDSLGYHYVYKIINSKDMGIPQNRNRIIVVGFKNEKYLQKFNYPKPCDLKYTLQDFLIENCAEGYFNYDNIPHHPGVVDERYFLSEKVKKHVMAVGTKNYVTIPKTDLEIARPLLATMHKMHRAGVDNYVTIDGRLRRLTPRECLRLMGFGDDFKQVVSDTQMYKQAGNSIVSDIFVHLIPCIIKTGVFE